MGVYYNPGNGSFVDELKLKIYVDKSMVIRYTNEAIEERNKFLCVSRPRRFGKSMAADMLVAYYSKGCDSRDLFKGLKIEKEPSFEKHLNKYDVIRMDFASFDGMAKESGENIISVAQQSVCAELKSAFPEAEPLIENSIANMLIAIKTKYPKQKFMIVIDEYDLIFRNYENDLKLQERYLYFLNSLFKNGDIKDIISLAYLTGILPIIREKAQSKLNEFDNFSMLFPAQFAEFVGFTEEEVKDLCKQYGKDFSEMKKWYNGYRFGNCIDIYNPRSVVYAIQKNKYDDYWVQTSSAETLFGYIDYNYEGLQEDVERLIAGERIPVKTSRFDNTLTAIKTKDDVLTYFIHLGYLAYDDIEGKCYIPNYEIKQEFVNTIEESSKYDYVVKYINGSKKLLTETWKENAKYVEAALDQAHTENTSILQYNDENSLSAVVSYAYMYANTYYTIVREMPSGKGFADMVFLPVHNDKPALIVELKFNKTVQTAMGQIKAKNYPDSLKNYEGEILLVAINYDKESKKHECQIERLKK
jgi:hypothetical protein